MQIDTILLTLLIVCILGSFFYLFRKINDIKPQEDKTLTEWLKSMEKRLDDNTRDMRDSVDRQTKELLNAQRAIYSKLNESAKTIGELSQIGNSLKDIQQFMASPKLRGGLGEQGLNMLLEQSLPKQSFNLQYKFRSGEKVDAAIKTSNGIVPIDSKFPAENYQKMMKSDTDKEREFFKKEFAKDVKNHIDAISKKYILADEGTIDYALMYIPAESVYYEIINSNPELMQYAYSNRVLPVSPSTFYAFLRAILLSFEGQRIADEVKNIQRALRTIHNETAKFGDLLSTLQTHVTNTYSMMNKVATQFAGLSLKVNDVQKISGDELEKEKEKLSADLKQKEVN